VRSWPQPPAALAPVIVTPQDRSEYARRRSTYMRAGTPAVIIRATTAEEVSLGVQHAAQVRRATGERVPFAVRSGGHGIAGTGTNQGGIVLDVRRMSEVSVDPATRLATIGAGATWGEVAAALAPHGLVISSGNFGDTGVGGLATAGGVGYFVRSQGLTLDAVRRVTLVTADGVIRTVDAQHEPELFWAVRGGATQVGVAVEFVIEATALGEPGAPVIHQNVQYYVDDLPAFTAAWGAWVDAAPRELTSFLMVQRAQGGIVVMARNVWAGSDPDAAEDTLRAALGLGRVMGTAAQIVPYADIVPTPGQEHYGQQTIHMRDVPVERADAQVGAAIARSLEDPLTLVAELRSLGGAVSDVPADATAWAGRSQRALAGIWTAPATIEQVDAAFAPLQELGTGTYGAYSSDTRPAEAERAWPAETGRRLLEIAQRVDPEHLFDGGLSLRS